MGLPRLALPILLAACGDVNPVGGPDGGGGDAPDAAAGAPDAGDGGSVRVTIGHVFGESTVIEGLTVLLVAPDGDVMETATDPAGVASADGVVAGSTMLVFLRSLSAGAPDGRLTIAVIGVEPGDDIEFADPSPPRVPLGAMTINFPVLAAADSYRVENGCTAAFPVENTTSLDFEDTCVRDGGFDLLIRAADARGNLLGWFGGGGRFIDGGTVDLVGSWSLPEDLSVNLVDIPAEPSTVAGRMSPIIGDLEYAGTFRDPVDLDVEQVEIRLSAPSAFVESRNVTIDVEADNLGFGVQVVNHRLPAGQDSLEIPLADELLPWYGVGVFDGVDRALTWTRSSGRSPDAQLVAATWIEEGEVVDNGIFLIAPPDVTSVTLPALPGEYPDYVPMNPSEINVGVFGAEASRFDGYRSARQRGFEIIDDDAILADPAPSETRLSGGPNADI